MKSLWPTQEGLDVHVQNLARVCRSLLEGDTPKVVSVTTVVVTQLILKMEKFHTSAVATATLRDCGFHQPPSLCT